MAIKQDRRFKSFEDTSKNPLATGTAQVLATCAGLLVRRSDDPHLRSLKTEVIGRLRENRTEDGFAATVYDYHIQRCESVLRRLNDEPEKKTPSPEERVAMSPPSSVKVTLDKVEITGFRGPMIQLRFGVTGVSQTEIAAARILIANVFDNTGFDLSPNGIPSFVHSAVGRKDDSVLSRNKTPSLDAWLNAPPGEAKRLVKLKGYMELVVPGYDRSSTLTIERVAMTAGTPVSTPGLAAAHVTITVFDAKLCNEALSGASTNANGPRKYGARPHFVGTIPKGPPPGMFQEPTITDSDIAMGIDDPDERVVATEFVAPDGTPLH
jgi:hypothetical protein